MHNLARKHEVIMLRKHGYSYSLISQKTGIPKATLSDWLADIPYTPNSEVVERVGTARALAGARHAHKKRLSHEKAHTDAVLELGTITRRDVLLFGLGLYLGEGSKTAGVVRIVNSDPDVIAGAVAWFRSLGVASSQFTPRLHLYPDSNVRACTQFWSEVLRLPVRQFQSPYIDVRTNKKQKKSGKLPYGTLHLGVRSGGNKEYGVFFFRKIQAMNAKILQDIKRA